MDRHTDVLMKHRYQMTLTEVEFIEICVRARAFNLHLAEHTVKRMAEKNVNECEAMQTLEEGYVVEMKANGRVLMRYDEDGKESVCVVFALKDRAIVTCWKNKPEEHAKPNLTPYRWTVNACAFMKQFQTT